MARSLLTSALEDKVNVGSYLISRTLKRQYELEVPVLINKEPRQKVPFLVPISTRS